MKCWPGGYYMISFFVHTLILGMLFTVIRLYNNIGLCNQLSIKYIVYKLPFTNKLKNIFFTKRTVLHIHTPKILQTNYNHDVNRARIYLLYKAV
jgi:hypothetical protein